MIAQIEYEESRAIPTEKYELVVWTQHEKLFRDREGSRNKLLAQTDVPFTVALQVKLRRSLFGTYLDDFNEAQWQNQFLNTNKMAIADTIMADFTHRQVRLFDYNNNLFDDLVPYLKNCLPQTETIDCGFLYEKATHLRLDDYYVSTVDDGLKNFKNLQVLVLCANWIDDIYGGILPRRLKFLELYVNEIKSLDNLVRGAPKHLHHLGLARNKLTDNSHFHLLAESGRFNKLKSLDLSECDIYRLLRVLNEINTLQNLESLLLQGNPCSMVTGYQNKVLSYFPRLMLLDGIEITKSDRALNENLMQGLYSAQFVLNSFQVTGLPQPPKAEKKVKQTFHVEYTLPLFQENLKDEIDEPEVVEESENRGKEKKGKTSDKKGSNKKLAGGSKKTSKTKSGKGSKKGGKSPYAQDDEYNPRKINNSFQTERKAWKKTITFPPVLLKSPESNLKTYRDTFRSRVNVRVVYLKFMPPEKKKKGSRGSKKEKKKGGDKSKKAKANKGKKKDSSKSGESEQATKQQKDKTDEKIIVEEPKEKILSEITMARFSCNLFSVNWKNDADFYWSNDPQFGDEAMELLKYRESLRQQAEDTLKAKLSKIKEKSDKKSKDQKSKKGKKSQKDKKSTKSKKTEKKGSKSSKKSKQDKISCQVGFGLSRLGKEIGGGDHLHNVLSKTKTRKTKKKN